MKDFHSPGNAKKNPNKIKLTLTYGTVEEMDDVKPGCFQGGALPGGAASGQSGSGGGKAEGKTR